MRGRTFWKEGMKTPKGGEGGRLLTLWKKDNNPEGEVCERA